MNNKFLISLLQKNQTFWIKVIKFLILYCTLLDSFSQSNYRLLQMFFKFAYIERFMLWYTNELWLIKARNDSNNFIFKSIPSIELHCLSHTFSLWWTFRHKLFYFDSVIFFNLGERILSLYDCFSHFDGVEIQQLVKLYNHRGGHLNTVFHSLDFSSFESKFVLLFFQNIILTIWHFIC